MANCKKTTAPPPSQSTATNEADRADRSFSQDQPHVVVLDDNGIRSQLEFVSNPLTSFYVELHPMAGTHQDLAFALPTRLPTILGVTDNRPLEAPSAEGRELVRALVVNRIEAAAYVEYGDAKLIYFDAQPRTGGEVLNLGDRVLSFHHDRHTQGADPVTLSLITVDPRRRIWRR